MKAIAAQLGLSGQVQVTRLLKLNQLRDEVRPLLIPQLLACVQTEALNHITADQLRQIDQTLAHILSKEVDQIIQEEVDASFTRQGRTKSLFAHRLCQTIHQFME